MPRRSRYSWDDERAYDAWLEYREQQEEREAEEAWEAEVDENCECIWAPGDEHCKYWESEYTRPVTRCSWHAERAAAAAERAAIWQEQLAREERERKEREERAAAEKKEAVAAFATAIGIELPESYVAPLRSPPVYNPTHKWRAEIYHVGKLLYILDGQGLPEELRVQIIGRLFTYLSYPENIGLVYDNAKFRAVVIAKITEFRGDARAEPIKESLERMEAALKTPPA